eukprot:TRINITY_DN8212_c0_g1_i5.p1 TRINITY_DN8212_c0_g1~~TRINITY_DN8212_c0_g1_i5.p1  ORF type:complete len:313 (+),score=88.90 TRINITY_DN8212_c0_g1_i5:201-1139(+)
MVGERAKQLSGLLEQLRQGVEGAIDEARLEQLVAQVLMLCDHVNAAATTRQQEIEAVLSSQQQQDGLRFLRGFEEKTVGKPPAPGQGAVNGTLRGKGVGIRAALKELLSMEQIAQVLVAASSTENVIRDCSLMGLSVESEGELDAASMFIGGEAPVSTGSGMHAWWVKKCSKSLGLTADQSERVQKRMAEYNTSVSTKREEVDVLLGKLKCELVKEVKNEGVMGELVESVLGKCEEVHSLEESTAQAVSSLLSAAQKNEGAKMLASLIEEQSQGCDAIDVEAQLGEWQAWCKCTELSGEQQDGVRKLLQHPH